MPSEKRPVAFWIIGVFLALSLIMLLLGQTTSLVAYDFAVRLGLQESVEEVTAFGVAMNRAFGASDTAIYVPLIVLSLVGLVSRKRWALVTTAAVMGISAYWAVTMASVLVFARGVPGYQLAPGLEYWIPLGAYIVFGIWGVLYLAFRSDELIH
jgi:hypothetical protein